MTAMVTTLRCPKCRAPLVGLPITPDTVLPCPRCKVPLFGILFPALYATPSTSITVELSQGNEAVCYYHPESKAKAVCDTCGRFLCSLCDMEFDSMHLCPRCLETARRNRNLAPLDQSRTLYDNMALMLAIIPLFITPIIALYLVFRHWRSPMSLTRRSKATFVAAAIFALIQLAGWFTIIIALVISIN